MVLKKKLNEIKKFFQWYKGNIKKIVRLIVFLMLFFVWYFFTIYFLFVNHNTVKSMMYLLLFFLISFFVVLEFYRLWLKIFQFFFIIFGIVVSIMFWLENFKIFFSICIFHFGLIVFYYLLNYELNNRISFRTFSYFFSGRYVFTIFVIFSYSFLFLWMNNKFDLTCDNLQKTTDNFIDFASKPLKLWIKEVKNTKQKVSNFFSTDVWDVIVSTQVISLNKNIVEENKNKWFIKKLSEKYDKLQDMVKKAIDDNKIVNQWICSIVVEQIKQKMNNPVLILSVLFLLFLVIYPFIRWIFIIVSFLWWIIFEILYLFKLYKKEEWVKKIKQIL